MKRVLAILLLVLGAGGVYLFGQGGTGNQNNYPLSAAGIQNSLGLQVFNTTTTCTTASTISTPCTTSAISLPVGYGDTNYRVSVTGLGVTAFPQVQTITKSNGSFTITVNNLTAAAASYTSFDVIVAHN